MSIKDLFKKDIDEKIQWVIMAWQLDDESIYKELKEFVITKETDKHLRTFFSNYKSWIESNSIDVWVWISWFFGSWKSHLLKIISFLLENRKVWDTDALNLFKEKIEDEVFLWDIESTVKQNTTDSILFNIDSKAEWNSEKDPILNVFVRVFYDFMWYYWHFPRLAEYERKLDIEWKYDDFKNIYKEISDREWDNDRKFIDIPKYLDFFKQTIQKLYSCSDDSAKETLKLAKENYSMSSDTFTDIVWEYCKRKWNKHKVIFLVDEIWQYIWNNTELMLNLQTLVEDFWQKLKWKAWIVVTSQSAIDELTNIAWRDFSKIQWRFHTKLSLSSSNTDEVIKKRLLEKKQEVREPLKKYYEENETIIKNLFHFSNKTAEMKQYNSSDDFVTSYPFIPYQFNLLQKVFEKIRVMWAAWAHIADWNRSMLNWFQEVLKQLKDKDLWVVSDFSIFYSTIEVFLTPQVKRTIDNAWNNSHIEEFDVEVLKLLFMTKYIDEVPKNIENLTTLLVSTINENKLELKEKIKESLKRLEWETLIHKSWEEYFFLTNEEQDINKQIKQVDVWNDEIIQYVWTVVFEEIYKTPKYSFSNINKFDFNKYVDDKVIWQNRQFDIWIKISTPWDDTQTTTLFFNSNQSILLIKLSSENKFLEYIKTFKQIEKYTRLEWAWNRQDSIRKILDSKYSEVSELKTTVKELIVNWIVNWEYFINWTKQEWESKSDPVSLINSLMKRLIDNVYDKLDEVNSHFENTQDIIKVLKSNDIEQQTLFDNSQNKKAIETVEQNLLFESSRSKKVTLKDLVDKFRARPYGWSEFDIIWIIATLFMLSKVQFKYNWRVLWEDSISNIWTYLTTSREYDKLVVSIKKQLDAEKVKNIQKIIHEIFKIIDLPEEQDKLYHKIKEIFSENLNRVNEIYWKYSTRNYPWKDIVEGRKTLFERVIKVPETETLFEFLEEKKEELVDLENNFEDINSFFSNQYRIFDKWLDKLHFYTDEENYLDWNSLDQLKWLKEILTNPSPYSDIPKINQIIQYIDNYYNWELGKRREEVMNKIKEDKEQLLNECNSKKVWWNIQEKIVDNYSQLEISTEKADKISKIDIIKNQLSNKSSEMYKLIYSYIEEDSKNKEEEKKWPKTKVVNIADILEKNKLLKTNEEIDEYTNSINQKLKNNLWEVDEIRIL